MKLIRITRIVTGPGSAPYRVWEEPFFLINLIENNGKLTVMTDCYVAVKISLFLN